MDKHILIIIVLTCLSYLSSFSQLSGGGDLNPDLKSPKKAQEAWQDLKIGLSVHWGPSSIGGKEISWARGEGASFTEAVDKETYDNFYKEFAPINFDAEKWVGLMKQWGIKYMAPTGKHHDGFALWFSDYSEYDMENAKLKIDIMKELSQACKKNDIMFGSYYSNLDWYHPDWHPYQHGGPGELFEVYDDTPNLDRYITYLENQVIELIEKYEVDFLQFDGEWDSTSTHEIGSAWDRKCHDVKPNILINSRIDVGRNHADGHGDLDGEKYCGDYQERERITFLNNDVLGWLDHPWQAWVTLDKGQWSYRPNPELITLDELILDMVKVIGNNGNYMINLGPQPDGNFDPEQVELMNGFGEWIHKHSDTVYGTRGGPFYPFAAGVSTRKGKKAWLFITDSSAQRIQLKSPEQRLKSAQVFGTVKKVPFEFRDGLLSFDLSKINHTRPVLVLELAYNRTVEMQKK